MAARSDTPTPVIRIAQRSPQIDSAMNLAFTNASMRREMITLLVIVVVIWTVIRIVQLAGWIWNLSNAPRIGVVPAAQG